ncbi:MAG: hypothetical protein IPJ41_06500 [Phycisphaerales bacterium]|nr:hypothetical protein [Phycisphaerales bacterium]
MPSPRRRPAKAPIFAAAAPLLLAAASASAQWASLQRITPPDSPTLRYFVPYSLTPDGAVLVGVVGVGDYESEAVMWTAQDGFTLLGDFDGGNIQSQAYAVSDDGSIITGAGWTGQHSRAFRWTSATGLAEVPLPPQYDQGADSFGYSITADGSTIAGMAGYLFGSKTEFRATTQESVGEKSYTGFGISADGAFMSGTGPSSGTSLAWRWRVGDPQLQSLDKLSGQTSSHAGPISRDGSTVIGDVEISDGHGGYTQWGFRWTEASGTSRFTGFPGFSAVTTSAWGVNGDGSIVVGSALSTDPTARARAFMWDAQHGERDLNRVLAEDYGVDLGEWVLVQAFAVSPDGAWIAGNAYHADVNDRTTIGWLAHLHQGCRADFNDDGETNTIDVLAFLSAWAAGQADADTNADGTLDTRDVIQFLGLWAAGC